MSTVLRSGRYAVVFLSALAAGLWFGLSAADAQEDAGPSLDEYEPRAYVQLMEEERFIRLARLSAALLAPRAAPAPERRVAVILVDFRPDDPSSAPERPFEAKDLENALFGSGETATQPEATLSGYYRDMSYNRWVVAGECHGWFSLDGPREDYEKPEFPQKEHWRGIYKMITEALAAADEQVDFSDYDVDLSQSDDGKRRSDGVVDVVFLVHPFVGHEENWSGRSNFHSHRYSLKELAKYLELQDPSGFVTNDARKDEFGSVLEGPDEEPQPVVIDDYILVPGLSPPGSCGQEPEMTKIGVYCHEYGHQLGLPDLYDPDEPPEWWGVGHWCLMAYGFRGGDGTRPDLPVPLNAWCRYHLGWAEPMLLTGSTQIDVWSSCETDKIFQVPLPGNPLEFFLIEHRNPECPSPQHWKVNWDGTLPGAGVLIWHVDEGKLAEGLNDDRRHPLIALEQADQLRELESKEDKGDSGDPWTDSDVFDDDVGAGTARRPANSRGYDKKSSGIRLSWVEQQDEGVKLKFDLERDDLAGTLTRGPDPPPPGMSAAAAGGAAPAMQPAFPTGAGVDMGPGGLPALGGRLPFLPDGLPKALAGSPMAKADRPLTKGGDSLAPTISTDRASRINRLAEKLHRAEDSKLEKLEPAEMKFLEALPDREIQRVVPPHMVQTVERAAKEARTVELTADKAGQTDTEKAIAGWLRESGWSDPVRVRVGADGKSIERISGMKIQLPREGSERLLTDAIQQGVAFERVLEPVVDLTVPYQGEIRQFQQTYQWEGEKLPVFGKYVTLYVDEEGCLKTVSSNALPQDALRVSGSTGNLTTSDATQLATQQLRIPEERIHSCRQGIGLIRGDPNLARVGFEVCIDAGKERRHTRVFVDGELKRVLYVE